MPDINRPSDEQTVAVVDVETTGLFPFSGDRICEVGIVSAQGDAILETYQTLVNPLHPISPGAARVNGLSDLDVCQAPLFTDIADQVLARIEGKILVCHNAPFDLGFVSSECNRLGQEFSSVEVIDTLLLARQHFSFDSNSLQSIANALMIDCSGAHRALADALTTRAVLEHFLVKLKRLPLNEIVYIYTPPLAAPAALDLPPLLQEALTSKKRLFICYVDKKGSETERWITPKQILALNDYIYVSAHCHLRGEDRSFRLDRISGIRMDDE